MKRVLCFLMILTVLVSAVSLAAADSPLLGAIQAASRQILAQVPDYKASEWARDELARADEADLIPGSMAKNDLTQPITRREYAAAAVALYEQLLTLNPDATVMDRAAQIPDGGRYPFTDVEDEAVTMAYRRGLIEGVGNGRFDPDGRLTREQAAAILRRILTLSEIPLSGPGSLAGLTDAGAISSWAKEGAAMMTGLAVIQGKPDGRNGVKFDPKGTLTGQEALVMNQRLAAQAEAAAQSGRRPDFNSALFAAVQSDSPNKSLSPVSVRYALGLLRGGAQGTTAAQLDRLLAGADFARWNQVLSPDAGDGPTVETANSIWFDTAVTPDAAYLNRVKADFDAQSQTLPLTAQRSVEAINRWVREKTHGLIPTILDGPLGDDAAAVLLNALYFKGDWAFPFLAENTRSQTFHNKNGRDVQVPFMHDARRGMQYIAADSCVGVALPYDGGELPGLPEGADPNAQYPTNNGWWMIVLLPGEGTEAESLAAADFGSLLDGAKGAYVRLALPKFTIEGTYDLTGPLQDLGLTAAFDGNGDLAPMGKSAKGELALSRVVQKTYLRVDEKGTEAAAVTGLVVATSSIETDSPIELTFDRPFLCCLWNDQIGQPLFLTAVNELS